MSYSMTGGYTPLTRSQMLTIIYNSAVANGYTGSFQDFKGSNIHRIHSETTLPYLETLQADFLDAQMEMFSYFTNNRNSVYGSYGASYEGWQNNFVTANLARGLNMVDTTIDATLGAPGNIALYFDMLDVEEQNEAIEAAFKRCIWPGMITPRGDYEIIVNFTAANGKKSYQYYNLDEKDYTKLDITIYITYKNRSMHYEPPLIKESVERQFNAINRIGMSFYPQSYFDHAALPNIAKMEIWSSLSGQGSFSKEVRSAGFGEKYIIHMMEVVVNE